MSKGALPDSAGTTGELQRRLFELIAGLARETHPNRPLAGTVTPQTRLDRDLGLDSMTRAELLLRMEREFGVEVPESAIAAETAADVLAALVRSLGREKTFRDSLSVSSPAPVEGVPADSATLTEALDWHLARHPDRVHIHLYGEHHDPHELSYAALDAGAREVARGLGQCGVGRGDAVALMLPTGLDYFFAFFGILRCGAVPVPIYPPARPSQLEEHLRRHGRILTNAGARILVTVPDARRLAGLLRAEAPRLATILTVADLRRNRSGEAAFPASAPDELALLQYTSGSTGDPKGVMLTHADLLANIRAMGQRLGATSEDVFVSWLPLYHDMGLIAAWLGSLYYAIPLVVMSPLGFLGRPIRWLELIHRHHGTISGAPNFGYELALRSLTPEGLEGLDLSSWRVAFNGAEPVSPDTMVRFIERLEPCGFRPEAMSPVYGLAEAAVGLCVPTPGRGVVLDRVDRESFANSGRAEPAGNGSDVLTFVNCGPPLPGYGIRVVDDAGRELPQRREGEIEFRGPSATAGYYSHSEATAELRHGDWLRTGDRGYLAGGDVHISGRQKDVIVRGGRNVYPYELEEAVGRIEGVRRGCVAVFGNPDPTSGAEALVVVAETRVEDDAARDRIEQAIREASLDIVDVPADDIRLVPPHSVLKTSSGKIRRAATRELYRAGRLGGPRSAVWQQVARMTLRSLFARLRLRVRRIGEWTYAAYAWTVFALAALPVWLLALVLPRRSWRWRVARLAARLAALVTGLRIERAGLENLPRNAQCILVANHASYLDALVLTAALPRGFCYLAKGELRERFFARKLLERMGAVFVDRFDPRQLGSDTRRVFAALDAGESLAFFPEGTFGSVPGLAAFHMGAFVAAARRRLPVVPVALAGTRSLMRGSEWFPRPGRARVAVGGALRATSDAWVEAVRLRDAARAFIAAECGEPDLTRE